MFHNLIHSRKTMSGLSRFIDLSTTTYRLVLKFSHYKKKINPLICGDTGIRCVCLLSSVQKRLLLYFKSLKWTLFTDPRVQETWFVEKGSQTERDMRWRSGMFGRRMKGLKGETVVTGEESL